MWRQTAFPGNGDSDQGISDEDDFDSDLLKNRVSFGESEEKKEGLELQSRLEILRGTDDPSYEGKPGSSLHGACDDEVEPPDLQNEDGLICSQMRAFKSNSDEEIISDDEENKLLSKTNVIPSAEKFQGINGHYFRSEKQDGVDSFSAVAKEASALVCLNKNASCSSSNATYSRANKFYRGVKGRAKPRFSFRVPSNQQGLSRPSVSQDDIDVSFKVHELPIMEDTIAEHLEDIQGGTENQSEIVPTEVEGFACESTEHSMAGLLDGLQDKAHLLRQNSKVYNRTRGKMAQLLTKRSISKLGDRTIDSEAIGGGSSSEDEAVHQNLKLSIPEMKRQTMTDRFQEILGAVSSNGEGSPFIVTRPVCNGLFGKLQQVMQGEKERDLDFLKRSQTGAHQNEKSGCMYVKILSRYLDAKLTVCCCSLGEDLESLQSLITSQAAIGDGGRQRTIIFNPRICTDVELEVGKLIRIHPPWTEVQVVGKDEIIILSVYFSKI